MRTSILFCTLCALLAIAKSDNSVYILSANLEQVVTSSTLQWVSSSALNNMSILESGVVAAYQIVPENPNNPDLQDPATSSKPVYVCRAEVSATWVSGHLRPNRNTCTVSMYGVVTQQQKFDVLINIENSSRLSWVRKDQYTLLYQGTVASAEDTRRTFVARRPTKNSENPGSLTHYVGKFNPTDNLGVFYVVNENDEELKEEEGEILVETEPISYEFINIKFDKLRSRHKKQKIILGTAILKNDIGGNQRIDSVITYNYTYKINWGKGHGLLTGLPFTVHLPDKKKFKGSWALPEPEERVETQVIEANLEGGTAVNVTLYGSLTQSDVPYKGIVVASYKDKEKKERPIADSKLEQTLTDIKPEFGPVYYLHNNSHVPTTTSTTTTTTTTTTTPRTTSTTQQQQQHQVEPNGPPEVNNIKKKNGNHAASRNNKQENNSMQSDGGKADDNDDAVSSKLDSSSIKIAAASSKYSINVMLLLSSVFVVLLKVT